MADGLLSFSSSRVCMLRSAAGLAALEPEQPSLATHKIPPPFSNVLNSAPLNAAPKDQT